MKSIIFLLSLITCFNVDSQSTSIAELIEKTSKVNIYNISTIDTVEKKIPCFGYSSSFDSLHVNGNEYDTLKCTGIVWCCAKVCELTFYEITEYNYEWLNVSDMTTLLYERKKMKAIHRYYYILDEQMKEKKWLIKPEYIIKILDEE